MAALRRGMPVILAGKHPLALLAVETADADSMAALARLAPGTQPVLLLSAARAVALLPQVDADRPVAVDAAGMGLAELQALADPTHPPAHAHIALADIPQDAAAALALAVLARLLPALLVASAPGRTGVVPADVLDHATLSAGALVRVSEAVVPLEDVTDARVVSYRTPGSGMEQYAILVGRPENAVAPLIRVHSECFTGDMLGSLRCDCGAQLRGAIRRMAAEGAGALLYLAQEGRGIGLSNKLRAYTLQDRGLDTLDANRALGFAADERDFLTAAAMLHDLGLNRVRVLTNNPDKLQSLAKHGIEVVGRESLLFAANGVNDKYLETKASRFGHLAR
ncbi:GTP cyclohydrolase II [Acidisphaera sp. L21]|uniref:GTP cyclohydrolase II n=1 Tax=Acidisphaera sp. L21 TaxID=1641851 RepID=UPI002342D3F8|nr:GTP cyclohydrolase II [Acidisphaera sp. L21]